MRIKLKNAMWILLLLAVLFGIGYVADKIPFYIFPETEEMISYAVFSPDWWMAMLPLFITVLAGLILAFILLKVFRRKKRGIKFRNTDQKMIHLKRYKTGKKPAFAIVRWICVTASFVLLIYGGKILGKNFLGIEIPVFACAFNEEQFLGTSCYYLSHLPHLLEGGVSKIVPFVITFLVSSILLGRILCSFICPMGMIQDLIHFMRQKLHMESVSTDEHTYQKLHLVKFLFLMVFLGVWIVGGDFCMLCPAITMSPAFAGFQLSLYASGFFMILVVAMSFLKRRAFCNICPLGYLVGLLHPVSLFRLKKNAIACTECGACYEACPMGIKSILTTREGKDEYNINITTADCIMCGECIRKCPENDALSMTFAGKKVYTASRMAFMKECMTGNCGKEADGT